MIAAVCDVLEEASGREDFDFIFTEVTTPDDAYASDGYGVGTQLTFKVRCKDPMRRHLRLEADIHFNKKFEVQNGKLLRLYS